MMASRRIRVQLFEPRIGGHHGSYLGILLKYAPTELELQLVVAPKFLTHHADLVALADEHGHHVVPLAPAELHGLERALAIRSPFSTIARPIIEWTLMNRYSRRLASDHAVSMYFDPLLQLCLPLRFPAPCPVSGIYFRPTFHYATFPDSPRFTPRDRVRAARQRAALARALAHPRFGVLFSLDRLAAPALQALNPSSRVVALPDPVDALPTPADQLQDFRKRVGLPEGRRIALIFGQVTRRKGLRETLDAISQLDSGTAAQLTLLIVGRMPSDFEEELRPRIRRMLEAVPNSVLLRTGFVPDEDVQRYFEAADLVVAPYQDHVGSSGIQIRAALAGKPLIGPRFGLMGELSRRYRLGPTVDSRSAREISAALQRFLNGESLGVDAARQREFGLSCQGQQFAEIFCRELASLESSRKRL